jgi:hypothetical protein
MAVRDADRIRGDCSDRIGGRGFGRLLVKRLESASGHDHDRHSPSVHDVHHDLHCYRRRCLPGSGGTRERGSDDILEHGQRLDQQHHKC